MFGNDLTQSGVSVNFDTKRPAISHDPRSKVAQLMLALAKRRNDDQGITTDVHAAFKEGERAPIAGASL